MEIKQKILKNCLNSSHLLSQDARLKSLESPGPLWLAVGLVARVMGSARTEEGSTTAAGTGSSRTLFPVPAL